MIIVESMSKHLYLDDAKTHIWWPIPRAFLKPEQVICVCPNVGVREYVEGLDSCKLGLCRVFET